MELLPFEKLIDKGYGSGEDAARQKQAVIYVADTAYACKLWFESYGLSATAADIIAMTRLVMEREAAVAARAEAEE